MNWTKIESAPRLLIEADLKPAMGDRFQPTGFADLGAAQYSLPNGTEMLLVESAQSVANRLEKTCLDGEGPDLAPELKGLPYVVATLSGVGEALRTSSLTEAHRIGSPYFLHNKDFKNTLQKEMKYDPKRPLVWKSIYATLFKYDPNSLLHGVFLALLEGGRVRAPRAVTGFIEAENVRKAISGGVKNSPIDPKGELQAAEAPAGEKGIYSNVPYSRVEFTAEKIRAYFNLDLALIRGYGLPPEGYRLLVGLALLKVRRFVDGHLRLRTACDFGLAGKLRVNEPEGTTIPAEAELLASVQASIGECKGRFAEPAVTEVETPVKLVKGKKGEGDSEAAG